MVVDWYKYKQKKVTREELAMAYDNRKPADCGKA